jgi:branched-chain amino acid transport system permease protein
VIHESGPRGFLRRHRSALALVVGVMLVTVLAQARPSLYSTSATVGILALIALPLGLMYGQGGTISIAQGTFAAMGGYTSAILAIHFGWSPLTSVFPAILVPAAFAFAIARPILRLPELSLALATLALNTVFLVGVERGGWLTGEYVGLSGIPRLPGIETSRFWSHVAIWLLVLIAVVLYSTFLGTARGRALNTVRVDRILAESMGVSVAMDLAILFAVTAGVAGLAGWFYVHYVGYVAPDSLGIHVSANALFMVVIGGRKTVLGPVVGAAIFILASDFLPGTETQGIFFGAILVLVLLLFPDGLLSLRFRRNGPRGLAPAPLTVAGAGNQASDTVRSGRWR